MVELVLLGISSVLNTLLGLFVYINNPRSATNKLFFTLTSSFVIWSIVSYFSVHPIYFSQVVWVRLVLFSATFLSLAVYLTLTVFPSHTMTGNKRNRTILMLATGIVMLLTITPYVFLTGIDGSPRPNFAIVFFALLVVTLFIAGIKNLYVKFIKSRGKNRAQLRIVLFSIVVAFGLILLTNLFLVVIFKVTKLISFGPSFTLIFTGTMAYATIKHRLFDIRATVARATVYLLITVSVALIYILFLNAVRVVVIPDLLFSSRQLIINIVITIVLVITYPYLKRYFDRTTNRVFFKEKYDPQDLIGELNKALVNNVDLEELLTKSSLIIQENLKASFTTFYIRKTSYFPDRVIGAHRKYPEVDGMDDLQEYAAKLKDKVFSSEGESTDDNDKKLANILKQNDIAVLARLVTNTDYQLKGIGYVLVGAKKSGSLYSKQDIKILEIIANELVIAIENTLRFEEIEQFNVTLQKKIDEATKELKQSNDKLKALDEAKDEFISMASHQLRTPLTSIKGYISMVLEGDVGKVSEAQEKMLSQALFSSQRMAYLISDLLNVSRLQTGKFFIESAPVYLPDLIEDEVNQLHGGAKAKELTIAYVKPEKFSKLNLDDLKMRQLVMNYIDNAIYYTPPGGKITIDLRETVKTVEFTVTDTGIGVPKDEQHKLFAKFYRADNARKARPDGTGLGLFMAKKVIIAQGGAIIFKSIEGKGSTFGFSFPKEKLVVIEDEKIKNK